MKLTLMRDNGETTTMRTLDINIQIETMKHETKAQPVSNLRTSIRYASPDSKLDDVKKLAKVVPAATFRKTVNGIQMTGYNGIIQIEVNHLANRMEVNRVKQEAAELSHTFAAFMGSGGHSVNMDTIHTSRQVTSSKTGRSGNISGKCLQESGQPIPARPFLCYRTEESRSGTVLPTDL